MHPANDTAASGWSELPSLSTNHRRLLQASGVANLAALARHDATKLWRWMNEVNAEERCTRRMPTVEEVQAWVQEAMHIKGERPANTGTLFLQKAIA